MKLYTIGSLSTSDICISNDPTVSRKHAQLFWDGKGIVVISDLGSLNGTFVNGNKITEPYRLKELDVVKVGNSLLSWREHVYGDKTIFNTPDLSNSTATGGNIIDDREENITPKKKTKLTPLFWLVPSVVLLVLLFLFLSSEERRLLGKWENKNSNTSYSFFKKNEFEQTIDDKVKSGSYEIVNEELLLHYDRKHLPISINNLTSKLEVEARYGFDDYINSRELGETFVLENLTNDTVVIHSIYAGMFEFPTNRSDFRTNVLVYKGDYRDILSNEKISDYKYSLVGFLYFNKNNYSEEDVVLLNEVIIPPKEILSVLILTNVKRILTYSEEYADESLLYDFSAKDENLKIHSGHSALKYYSDDFYDIKYNEFRWLGAVNYSLLNPNKEHTFSFIGNNTLQLDSIEYVKQ